MARRLRLVCKYMIGFVLYTYLGHELGNIIALSILLQTQGFEIGAYTLYIYPRLRSLRTNMLHLGRSAATPPRGI